jgi:hypothetical protein
MNQQIASEVKLDRLKDWWKDLSRKIKKGATLSKEEFLTNLKKLVEDVTSVLVLFPARSYVVTIEIDGGVNVFPHMQFYRGSWSIGSDLGQKSDVSSYIEQAFATCFSEMEIHISIGPSTSRKSREYNVVTKITKDHLKDPEYNAIKEYDMEANLSREACENFSDRIYNHIKHLETHGCGDEDTESRIEQLREIAEKVDHMCLNPDAFEKYYLPSIQDEFQSGMDEWNMMFNTGNKRVNLPKASSAPSLRKKSTKTPKKRSTTTKSKTPKKTARSVTITPRSAPTKLRRSLSVGKSIKKVSTKRTKSTKTPKRR